MTRSRISNMAAVSETLLASLLVLSVGVSGFPLGQEGRQALSCGYEVSFVRICSLSDSLKPVNGALAQVIPVVTFTTKFQLVQFLFPWI